MKLEELLRKTIERDASDLHLAVDSPPVIRINEKLIPLGNKPLSDVDTKELAYSIMSEEQRKVFEREDELDLSFGIKDVSRFRVNVFKQKDSIAVAIRAIPYKIKTFEELGLPVEVTTSLTKLPKGLVLVTGATGSGKSTTLASMIDRINENRPCHIITVEDPIEYVHTHKKALVNQREIGTDTHSFVNALKYVLRQDPDVILIGEMRDLETMAIALTAAETGHLVFATLHTNDATQSINRLIDVFPPHQQNQIRIQLSFVLQAILSQQLIPRADEKGRVLALEVMVITPAIRSMIRESKTHQLYSVIQTGGKFGMRTMNQSLYELVQRHLISQQQALERSLDPEDLRRLFKG
ncbi:MAG: type IV pilus twitching motility protein PilT [Candidatus Omnitrophica bacterium]|nr:type IV pilus twitching motility protein PilT [Candidatus Omnitrophota bacterium]